MEKICIVHDRKYLSKFHAAINQLRQLNEFNISILQQLPKRCCSCHGRNGESSFTVDHLRELCRQIQPPEKATPVNKSPPVKPIHYVILEFPPTLTLLQRLYKAGRFVGRNGQNIRLLQNTLNVDINIFNNKSKKNIRETVNKMQVKNNFNDANGLWVLITMKNDNDDIQKVKQSIENTWKQIDVTTRKVKIRSSPKLMAPRAVDVSEEGDTRWITKKRKPRDKYKIKQNQCDELEEVAPQPFVRPISMPKELTKYRKNKRK